MVAPKKAIRSHTPKKGSSASQLPKKPVKANQSILSFFKKAEKHETSLFLGESQEIAETEDLYTADDADISTRFNETDSPNKRRKLSQESEQTTKKECSVKVEEIVVTKDRSSPVKSDDEPRKKSTKPKIKTPFVDSDSEDEPDQIKATNNKSEKQGQCTEFSPHKEVPTDGFTKSDEKKETDTSTPALKQEDSTYQNFDDFEDITDEELPDLNDLEGEEMRVMRFMKEQARLEAEEAGISSEDLADDPLDDDSMTESCPICNGSLAGISIDEATRHVNSCLDGHPIPLPKEKATAEKPSPTKPTPNHEVESTEVGKRFARAAVPRPGQANPLDVKTSGPAPKTAFSKLMSNNAEDSAWQEAAAAEYASRGKQAYERTCPFYKIMPGFSICVDAFRYGAVQGCKAYFLSHFHSDHYIGLTARWCHGPIYCSKVTGSLVRNQLRTAAKWVVELEFDKSYDIPGTEGATVTMIPANHCPGSSLFLFEKTMKQGTNSRVQRILHCGDFRACPAHVKHPLLKPEISDSISGKIKQQKIDICYLDTTYLNPRYSFPPQNDVIKACADLCGSMSPDPNCKDDIWEKASGQGTPAVSKFFPNAKPDEAGKVDTKNKPPQRLLVICGTYSIGKERICISIAKALKSKIFASPGKIKICKQLDDPELSALLTSDPLEAQVHMQMLMEIRAETLQEYLNSYKPYFSRIVGLRPSGWNFRPAGKAIGANTPPGSIHTQQILHDKGWRTRFGYKDFIPQRGSTKEAMCFGVPYSEHSSFRELAMFLMSLRIEKVVPTVNVGSEQSRKRMKGWIDRWLSERRRAGLVIPLIEGEDNDQVAEKELWDGKPGKAGGAFW
ncbi:DNA repair metallo-beta-lactamase-domain-containing protein [Fusarium flagelliforme]|uniref:DNA repair metallo-beta-lactamase-domain-containing protein n=1 Tax=Fusarium flagelliforme TaxID=2675880 RepID=UPI001E8D9FFB|nr:DNA repair metallo-beta-lactamase-domain-containing protein [Fusarium flagelliforme]KAH7197073.1 DNA repair metallo-beta-lactamase-domain-containing protein [Fusarium flagelliforme]